MFQEKIFESLTIEVQINKNKYLLSSVYRPPNTLPNITAAEQFDVFTDKPSALLGFCNNQNNCNSLIFTDSNLNLHRLHNDQRVHDYLNNVTGAGFMQIITKSTRINDRSYSLIDHILTNRPDTENKAGVIVSDISDHFFTFIELNLKAKKQDQAKKTKHDMGEANVQRFKDSLRNTNWESILSENAVDTAFQKFWDVFKSLYDLCFPLITVQANKNIHKKKQFYHLRHTDLKETKKHFA